MDRPWRQPLAYRAVMYFGDFRTGLVPYLRMLDPSRRIYLLRGDDILVDVPSLGDACRQFRVSTIIVEPKSRALSPSHMAALASLDKLEVLAATYLERSDERIPIIAFRYTGPVVSTMREVPLRSNIVSSKMP